MRMMRRIIDVLPWEQTGCEDSIRRFLDDVARAALMTRRSDRIVIQRGLDNGLVARLLVRE